MKPGKGWLTKQEMAAAFDVSVQQFDRTYRRFAGADAVKDVDGKLYFHARSMLVEWAKTQQAPAPAASGEDPLLTAGDSPALEEYRKARARLAWMEVNEREKTHLPLATLEPSLMSLTGVLRRAGDRLARLHGNDAAAILNEAVDQWESSVESQLSNEPDAAAAEEDRAEHSHAPAANAARVR